MAILRARRMSRLGGFVLGMLLIAQLWAQDPPKPADKPQSSPAAETVPLPPPGPAVDNTPPTEAERIARLQRSIEEDGRLIQELRTKLNDPDSEYAQAEREFSQVDTQVDAQKKELARNTDTQPQADADAADAELKALETKRKLAKERFDLAIAEHKTLQEQLATLEQKTLQDQAALAKLKGTPASQPAAGPAAVPASQPAGPPAAPVAEQPTAPAAPTAPTPAAPAAPLPSAHGAAAPAPPVAPGTTEKPVAAPSKELQTARTEAASKQAVAQEAAQQAQSATERLDATRKAIALEQKLLQTARDRADNAQETEKALYDELQTKWQSGASHEQLTELRKKIGEVRERTWEAEREIRERTDRISKLGDELSTIQSEQLAAARHAEEARSDAESAQKRVEKLENPWSIPNILNWLLVHGPRMLAIIIGMAALLWFSRLTRNRIIKIMSVRAQHASFEDQENRMRTLVGVFSSAAAVAIYTGGTLMLLTEVDIDIVPLLGGAAVLGLAVAFGAQNLIRDYFYGFMILLENQYTINDVVKLGDTAGQVENITLRITTLRGLDGTVHFVPNGQITQVSNMTHGWSRALFEIGVSYNENVDRVMEVLMELSKELRRDPAFRGMILEMPEMLGVDEFSDSAVVIKFLIKTRPLKQWAIKRELLRRIKLKFDELGIEIPYPHRTVYHRMENQGPLAERLTALSELSREPKAEPHNGD